MGMRHAAAGTEGCAGQSEASGTSEADARIKRFIRIAEGLNAGSKEMIHGNGMDRMVGRSGQRWRDKDRGRRTEGRRGKGPGTGVQGADRAQFGSDPSGAKALSLQAPIAARLKPPQRRGPFAGGPGKSCPFKADSLRRQQKRPREDSNFVG